MGIVNERAELNRKLDMLERVRQAAETEPHTVPVKKWNTLRLSGYGASVGLVWAIYHSAPLWHSGAEYQAHAVGGFVAGMLGGAAVVAIVVGLRNAILRAR